MSRFATSLIIAMGSAVACASEPRPPDLVSLAQAVASGLRTGSATDSLRARRALVLGGGPTRFDSMVVEAIRRGGALVGGEGGPTAVTTLRTEGVAFRGDTAAVWVTKSTCDPAVTNGFTAWSTDVEYRFVPVRQRSASEQPKWRALDDGQIRLSDGGTC